MFNCNQNINISFAATNYMISETMNYQNYKHIIPKIKWYLNCITTPFGLIGIRRRLYLNPLNCLLNWPVIICVHIRFLIRLGHEGCVLKCDPHYAISFTAISMCARLCVRNLKWIILSIMFPVIKANHTAQESIISETSEKSAEYQIKVLHA